MPPPSPVTTSCVRLWHSAYIRLARAPLETTSNFSPPHLNSYFISDCYLKGTPWLLERRWSLWLTPSYRSALEEGCEPPAPPNRGGDVRDSRRPPCKAVLLAGRAAAGVGNRRVGALRWVGGEQVKDALLSFPVIPVAFQRRYSF